MRYRITEEKWENADHTVKLGGVRIPAASSREWLPEKTDRIGETRQKGKKSSGQKDTKNGFEIGHRFFEVKPLSKGGADHIFYKEKGWIQATDTEDSRKGYIQIRGFRMALVPVFVLIAAALVSLLLYLNTGVAPIYQPQYIADQTGITNNRKDPKAEIGSYSAYQSVPDQIWTAGETHQEIRLVLPATVTTKDKYNREVSYSNPVDAAPHIYVDLNADGEFSEDECVFNPMTFDKNGKITDIGALLQAGNQIDSVELTRPIDQGEYDAEVVWTGITSDTHEMANPMTFQFHLTVQ